MILRQALFEGTIKAGQEEAFKAYVAEKLMPMWLAFPGIKEVRVLYNIERDEGAPSLPMVVRLQPSFRLPGRRFAPSAACVARRR